MSELQQPFVADLRRAADGLAHAQASYLLNFLLNFF